MTTKPKAKQRSESPPGVDLRSHLEWLLARHEAQGGVTELRLGPSVERATYCGYFRPGDLDAAMKLIAAASAAAPKGGKPRPIPAISYTPHPVAQRLYERSRAKFTRCEPAGPLDILAYSMVSARVEPYREEYEHASEEERQLALAVAQAIIAALKPAKVPVIVIDAGDWYELLLPTAPYTDLWRAAADAEKLSHLLHANFSTRAVLVGGGDSASLIRPVPLPGTVLPTSTESTPRHVRLLGPVKFPSNDVDLFSVLADDLSTVQAEPDGPPDEPDEPTPGKPCNKKQDAPEPADKDPSQTEPKHEPDDIDHEQDEDAEGYDEPGELPASKPRPRPAPVAAWDAATAAKVLAEVLQRAGVAFRTAKSGGEQIIKLTECPLADGDGGKPYGCHIAVLADGTFAPRCRHDEHLPWKEVRRLIAWDDHVKYVVRKLGVPPRSLPYRATGGGLVHLLRAGKHVRRVPLSNWTAHIVRDREEDDGVETRRTLEIEARLDGQTRLITLPAARFQAMQWPLEFLGARAMLHPEASKRRLVAAIQSLSTEVVHEKVFKHTGWRQHAGRWVYLHAGGAVGEHGAVPGVRVELPRDLSLYQLPEPPEGLALRDAVRASLRLLDVAPDAVTVPLYAGIWRVVVDSPDFSFHLVGPSGSGKTALASLVQQHWGPAMSAQRLPASWLSTANANEYLAFLTMHAVLVIDDYVPQGGGTGSARQRQEADRLFRGQGNSTGRARLGSSPTPPRGGIYSTGEAMPAGQSMAARVMVLRLGPDDVVWDRMTACQQDAAGGHYAAALSGFIRWLAPRLDKVREGMTARLAALRDKATAGDLHRRTPGIVADLHFGLELFAEFAASAKAVSKKQSESFLDRCWKALGAAAAAQAEAQGRGDPAKRFLALLKAALAAGKAHVAGPRGGPPDSPQAWGWRQQGETWTGGGAQVGWVKGDALYLDPEVAPSLAQQMASGGEPLTAAGKTLHKRLHEAGLLSQVDEKRGRLLVRRTLAGEQREVLCLPASAVLSQPQAPPPGPAAPLPAPIPPEPGSLPEPAPVPSEPGAALPPAPGVPAEPGASAQGPLEKQ